MMKKIAALALLLFCKQAAALITYVGIGAVAQSVTSQTVTISCPATPTVGDVQFIYETFDNTGAIITPAGFTAAETNQTSARWYYRVIVTGAESNPTVATGTTTSWQAVCLSLRGVSTSSPINQGVFDSGSSSTQLRVPQITVSGDNQVLLYGGRSAETWTSVATVTNFTEVLDSPYTGTAMAVDYWIQPTATNIGAAQTVAITGGSSATNIVSIIAVNPALTAPTFSVAPAVGTRTTSTIPITATTACTDCNYYGVSVVDGSGAPTCTQIKAGQNSGGTAAYKAFGPVAMTTTVQNTGTFSTYTDGTIRDSYYCLNSTANGDSAVSSLADIYKIPARSAAFANTAHTSTGYTVGETLDGAGTCYNVACAAGSTAPTFTQVEAAQCTGGAAALASVNEAVTGADTRTLGGSLTRPVHDLYEACTYGSQHEAAAAALTSQPLNAPAGKQYVTIASISATSWCKDFNDLATPDIAVADILKIDLTTTPSLFTWTQGTDCDGLYTGDTTRQYLLYDVYDASVGDYMSGGPGTLWFNDIAPTCPASFVADLYKIGVAITPIDLVVICPDPEGDALTCALTAGTLPTGLSLTGTGSCTVSGTPTAENEAGADVTFSVTDAPGQASSITSNIVTLDTVTVPTCIGVGAEVFEEQLDSLHIPWAVTGASFSATIAAGNITVCSPAATSEIDPLSYGAHTAEEVSITLSLGIASSGIKHPQIRMGIGIP